LHLSSCVAESSMCVHFLTCFYGQFVRFVCYLYLRSKLCVQSTETEFENLPVR